MDEPISNIGLVCEEHSPKSGKFKGQDPNTFIGKYAKLGFKTEQGPVERMWVLVTNTGSETQLEGVLFNDPIYNTGYKFGDSIGFDVDEIEAVTEPST